MPATVHHLCKVFATPWPGVHGTWIDSARQYGRHWHDSFGIGLLEQGAQTSASGRGSVDAYAGDLITTNPGEVHDGRPMGGPSRRWRMLYFEPSAMPTAAGDSNALIEFKQPVIRDPALRQAFRALFALVGPRSSTPAEPGLHALACEEALIEAFAHLAQRRITAARQPERETGDASSLVRDRLADELLAPPTLADLAAMSGCSRYQLLRQFKARFGVPPHAWLLQRRAEHARRLIRDGAGLAQAAATSGFADQSHLSRVFLRQFGFTPGAWRRATLDRRGAQ